MLEIYKNKKVLITGHTGFKGSWLSCILEVLGAKQIGYSLAPNTQPSHFQLLNLDHKSIIEDISNFEKLSIQIQEFQPDIIFHLAAQPLVIDSYKNPINTYQTNVMGTLNLLESVRLINHNIAVVVVTTDKVYENNETDRPYKETDPLGGYDMYSSSKAATEILTKSYVQSFFNKKDYNKNHNTIIATARGGNVIGGGDWSNDRLIPDIVKSTSKGIKTIIRNPNSIRPWQHVLDCLFGYLHLGSKLLNKEIEFSGSWNFAPFSSDTKSVIEVIECAKMKWSLIDVDFDLTSDKVHEASILKLDNSKSISLLSWKPILNTEIAIEYTLQWYKSFYEEGKVITFQQIENYFKLQ